MSHPYQFGGAFNVGRFAADASGSTLAPVVDLSHAPQTERDAFLEKAAAGDRFFGFGFSITKNKFHLMPRELQAWRSVGDTLADDAIDALKHACPSQLPNGSAIDLLRRMCEGSLSSSATHAAAAEALVSFAVAVPDWVDWAKIRRGQLFFERNCLSLLIGLLNLSLTGGFGAPKINAVLESTGYLTRGKGVMRRLAETLQMVLDCLPPDALRPGQPGWRSVLNVRLLHAGVRTWLVGSQHFHRAAAAAAAASPAPAEAASGAAAAPSAYAPPFDVSVLGVPINQEDTLVTQLAFSLVPLMGLERVGLLGREGARDIEDYLHLWRYIGHLVGLAPALNGAAAATLPGAQALLESVAAHVVYPDPSAARIALHVIESATDGPPLRRSPTTHTFLTRALAGDAYADALGIPRLGDPALAEAEARHLHAAADSSWATPAAADIAGAAARLQQRAAEVWAAPSVALLGSLLLLASSSALLLLYALLALGLRLLGHCAFEATVAVGTLTAAAFGARSSSSGGGGATTAHARAMADAATSGNRLLSRLRVVQALTHLPAGIGALVARALAAGVVKGVQLQLGGRTAFPVRPKYAAVAASGGGV